MKKLSEYQQDHRLATVYENIKGTFTVTMEGEDSTIITEDFGTEFEAECRAEDYVLAVDEEKIILKPRGGVL